EGVAILPDIDGDGLADVAIGATHGSAGGRGYVEVRTGDGSVRWRVEAPTAHTATSRGWFGWNVASAGDVNADGTTDLLVADVHSYVRAYSGKDGERLLELDYLGGYVHGEGTSLDGVGDLNGDGHGDFLIGANESSMHNHSDQGWVWIHSGSDGELLYRYDPGRNPGPEGGYGVDAAGIGDVDCDGLTDIAVAVPRAGRIEILSGQDFSLLFRLDAAALRRP
ncbi:MAG: VCBS repeat-containing protein, partial [Planctomycetota bacterium]|nr:VCBS repeat-containing protein [Planctomycetota bacterium]